MRLFWMALVIIGVVLLFIMLRADDGVVTSVSDDQLARFAYLAIIGLMVAAAVLASGLRLGALLYYGLIWCVLIFALIFGYNNRHILQDIGHQVTMGLLPASSASQTEENGLSVTLRRAANGHFETHALVNGGTHIYFMFDTGASSVALSYEDAQRIGIDMSSLDFSMAINTANGESRVALTELQSLKIGEIERFNIRALVAPPQALSDSLLGMSFLNSLSGYTVRADQLTLID